ncbi:MAG TPA: right-handed parallel beta-helix repeat-containing protein [Methylomirabilota bacterium]|jgi:nitrous oxidase accessory protein NosD|nr:right-handed parallel beta-helix repeat-containing protein [Methylomirabilota bacterium]
MMHRRALLLGALASAACDASSSSSSGPSTTQAKFMAVNGNDRNSANEIAPVRTLARALSLVTAGTTLFIKGGVYQEATGHSFPSGRSWDAPLRIAAYQGQPVVLRPAGTARVLDFVGRSYVIVDGLTIDAARVTADGIKITEGSHHIRIQNTEVMNAPSQGILLSVGAHSNELVNLRVHDNGRNDFCHGIYVATDNNLIENCEIYRNAGWGVHAWEAPNNLTVRGCRIYQNARVGARGPGIGLYGGAGLRAHNNEVWGNAVGITAAFGSQGAEILGNRVYNNRGQGIFVNLNARGTRVDGNTSHGNGGGNLVDFGEGTRIGANQIA